MAVSVFPVPAAGGGGSTQELVFCPSGATAFSFAGDPGIYTVQAWSATYSASPTVSVSFYDSTDAPVGNSTLFDPDSGSTANRKEAQIRATASVAVVGVNTNVDTYVLLEFANAYKQGTVQTTESFTTSQDVTFAAITKGVIIGGGGAGAANNSNQGGGGGGSGYATSFTLDPGTYSLVVGAGGAGALGSAGGNGGTTTFAGLSAVGGSGAPRIGSNVVQSGGDGGSGGGGGGAQLNSAGGGDGGTNGANGETPTSGGAGGVGSGDPLPYYATPGSAGAGAIYANPYIPATGGGVYAGGGGGSGTNGQTSGSSGAGGGGVSAGSPGGLANTAGGNGGAGGLIILVGA